jgi:hypothetical protein
MELAMTSPSSDIVHTLHLIPYLFISSFVSRLLIYPAYPLPFMLPRSLFGFYARLL